MRIIVIISLLAAFAVSVPARAERVELVYATKLPRSFEQLRDAAESGDINAQYELGYAYMGTYNIPVVDYDQAVRWTRLAAERGHPKAQYNLGVLYYHGLGVPISYWNAVYWWRKAAEQGEQNAQYLLGYEFIVQGYNAATRGNTIEALKWWQDTAEKGESGAQFFLGVFYHDGNGVPKNNDIAFKWFTRGAAQGDARAQNGLGAMFFNGEGTRKDYVKAYQWFSLAASKGNLDGVENRNMVEDYMTKEQVIRAQDDTREWASNP